MSSEYFATCPRGLEGLLKSELAELGFKSVRETVAGVSFEGDAGDGGRACLYSRFASRVLLKLAEFEAPSDGELYAAAAAVPYENWFGPERTLAVDFSGQTPQIRDTRYGAVRIKDAVCDRFRKLFSARPDVDRDHPEVLLNCHLERSGRVLLYIDLSGPPLHRRAYRLQAGAAPLKENLAAAIIARSGYAYGAFCDPLCGSGTLLVEAASRAVGAAPGLRRGRYGFCALKGFDRAGWEALRERARAQARAGLERALSEGLRLVGFDSDEDMVAAARGNVSAAGFEGLIEIRRGSLAELRSPFAPGTRVTVATNPPYGRRMGDFAELIGLYSLLGRKLRSEFPGAAAAVISADERLLSCLRLRADRLYRLYNGELPCTLRVMEIREDAAAAATPGAPDFAARLKKNLRRLGRWARGAQTDCYRVYDADVPEYAAAIDFYNGYYVVQEYAAPPEVPPERARAHLLDMLGALVEVTGARGSEVILKSREKKKGAGQYEKAGRPRGRLVEVHENGLAFKVNLEDYLDTGLFLDGREIRSLIRENARGRDFLNLFAYTASASLAAAAGGARTTASVDMSRTYLEWGRDNFRLNHIDPQGHEFIQADCLGWLARARGRGYDLAYVDPPTFSNSKRMYGCFDVRRDHLRLLANLTRVLRDGAVVFFCVNFRNFRLNEDVRAYGLEFENISERTLPPDFRRDPKIHTCYRLRYSAADRRLDPEPFAGSALAPKWEKILGRGEADAPGKAPGRGAPARRAPRRARVWGPDGIKEL